MFRRFSRRFLAFGMGAIGFTSLAMASDPPSTGLGQAWPNAADVSLSPHYHVYVFGRDGVRYIQINDINGVVRGAIARVNEVVVVLPVGIDAAHVKVRPAGPSASPDLSPAAETVYRDQAMTVSVTPQSTGATQITATQLIPCTDPGECTNGGP